MGEPMRVIGLDEVITGLRRLERTVPGEVDDMLVAIMETDLLDDVREETPVGSGRSGSPGRLKAATRVGKVRGRPAFVNAKVYAPTIHWGRVRRGRVVGRRFIWDAVRANRDVLERKLTTGVSELIDKHLP